MNVETWKLEEARPESGRQSLSAAISRTFAQCDCGYQAAEDFDVEASFSRVDLGPTTLVHFYGQGVHWAERRYEHVRHFASDNFIIYLPHDCIVTLNQRGVSSTFSEGSMGFISTRKPFRGELQSSGEGSFESTSMIVNGSVLRSRIPCIDQLSGQTVEIGDSLHNLFASYVPTIDLYEYESDAQRSKALSDILLEAICSVSDYALTKQGDSHKTLQPIEQARERIRAFILANLTNPDISVTMIAKRLNMSPRYVHKAFEDTKWTVKSWVRHRRLIECRKTIRLPSMARRTLTDIAFSWGFSDFSHFSRCYKQKFGCSPIKDRPAK